MKFKSIRKKEWCFKEDNSAQYESAVCVHHSCNYNVIVK